MIYTIIGLDFLAPDIERSLGKRRKWIKIEKGQIYLVLDEKSSSLLVEPVFLFQNECWVDGEWHEYNCAHHIAQKNKCHRPEKLLYKKSYSTRFSPNHTLWQMLVLGTTCRSLIQGQGSLSSGWYFETNSTGTCERKTSRGRCWRTDWKTLELNRTCKENCTSYLSKSPGCE